MVEYKCKKRENIQHALRSRISAKQHTIGKESEEQGRGGDEGAGRKGTE